MSRMVEKDVAARKSSYGTYSAKAVGNANPVIFGGQELICGCSSVCSARVSLLQFCLTLSAHPRRTARAYRRTARLPNPGRQSRTLQAIQIRRLHGVPPLAQEPSRSRRRQISAIIADRFQTTLARRRTTRQIPCHLHAQVKVQQPTRVDAQPRHGLRSTHDQGLYAVPGAEGRRLRRRCHDSRRRWTVRSGGKHVRWTDGQRSQDGTCRHRVWWDDAAAKGQREDDHGWVNV
jgi:hypothetical protein